MQKSTQRYTAGDDLPAYRAPQYIRVINFHISLQPNNIKMCINHDPFYNSYNSIFWARLFCFASVFHCIVIRNAANQYYMSMYKRTNLQTESRLLWHEHFEVMYYTFARIYRHCHKVITLLLLPLNTVMLAK